MLEPGDEAAASTAGLRLRAALEQSFEVGGIRVHIDASVGIALYPDHAADALGLLQRADVAMYEAKRMRTGHEVYLAGRDRHSRERLALVGELRGALEAGELVLHYQPQGGAAHGQRSAASRRSCAGQHPERGLLGAGHFLPLVEQSGLTRALTAFVLDRALEEIGAAPRAASSSASPSTSAPPTCSTSACPSEVERLLAHAPLRAASARSSRSPRTSSWPTSSARSTCSSGCARSACATALDDFGAGHAALGHLKQLHVDELKIDRSFVMRAGARRARRRDRALAGRPRPPARAAGRRRGRREPPRPGSCSAEWGCDEAQGHFLGRPMPVVELERWLREPSALKRIRR